MAVPTRLGTGKIREPSFTVYEHRRGNILEVAHASYLLSYSQYGVHPSLSYRDMAMRRIFWGFCRDWVLIDPLQYLSSRSAFGFEFTEIFVIEKRLPDSASWRVGDSPTRRVGESLTLLLGESGSRRLTDSPSRGVGF